MAKLVGVHERTVGRWLAESGFRRHVDRIRNDNLKAAMGVLTAGTLAAASELLALVSDPCANIRLKASQAVILLSVKLKEIDLHEKLEELQLRQDELEAEIAA